ncbi:MAG: hypothetical protein K2Z81_13690, partial [Cyanobacteria bacterium]|nr:hypothetical protein [Cyanobacteriota bacterium]
MPAESKNTHRTNKFSPIAIIGMSCLFPGSPDLSTFWANLVAGQSEIREATPSEWDSERYSHRSTDEYGAIYCSRGGFITDMAEFNPIEHGVMPKAVNGADPDQFIALSLA